MQEEHMNENLDVERSKPKCALGDEYIEFCGDALYLGIDEAELERIAKTVKEYGLSPEEARDYLACIYAWHHLHLDDQFAMLLYLLYRRYGVWGCDALLEISKRVEKIREKLGERAYRDTYLLHCRDAIITRYNECKYLSMYPGLLVQWQRMIMGEKRGHGARAKQ